MTLPVYHFDLTVDNSSSTQQHPPLPFRRHLFHPLLARRDVHSTKQPGESASHPHNPQVHSTGGK